MKNIIKNLVAIIGLSLLGIGIVNATPSSGCGDDDTVRPITVHDATTVIIKES